MEFKSDLELLNDFSNTRNLKEISRKTYNTSINLYSNFNNKPFYKLIMEAEKEELDGIRWKDRKLKRRLIGFRNFLTSNYQKNYSRITFSRILTLYRHFDIEIHTLPPQSTKNYMEPVPITFNDLPTKNIIKRALKLSSPVMRAIILFMSSSGCARMETLNLKIEDFINATRMYHDSNNIREVLDILDGKWMVPVFKLKRQKTNKYYFTFTTPEATTEIVNYLKTRNNLKNNDQLFEMHPESVSRYFIRLNEKLCLGKVGGFNRFRSHMLRKFNASSLKNDGMIIDDVNSIQGKSRNYTDEAYFFENPMKLREVYINHMNALIIDDKYKIKKKTTIKENKLEINT